MGKGSRSRAKRQAERPAYEVPLAQAAKKEKTVRKLCVFSTVLSALLLLLPSWSVFVISQLLGEDAYNETETATLSRIIPLGQWAPILILAGVVAALIFLFLRKPILSLFGVGVYTAGTVLMYLFAITLGDLFAYNAVLDQGLTFMELVYRYYILIIPNILLIIAVFISFSARKKREIAEMMKNASDPSSTLSLDEENTTQNAV